VIDQIDRLPSACFGSKRRTTLVPFASKSISRTNMQFKSLKETVQTAMPLVENRRGATADISMSQINREHLLICLRPVVSLSILHRIVPSDGNVKSNEHDIDDESHRAA
jgi:hypothetical protein